MALLLFAGGPSAGGQAPAGPNAPDKLPFGPGPGAPTGPAPSSSPAVLAQGRNLYEAGCSSCHGYSLQGRTGMGPALAGVGAGPVDFYLSSGRMPLANPRDEPERATPAYPPAQIAALVAFVASYGGPPAPTADPARGDLALGRHAFTLDCAGCHQVVARGGLVIGAQVPNLLAATPSQLAEAVRMGPYLMPRFDATQIDQHTLDSIARYVQWTKHPDNAGGWGLYNIGPVPEGMVAWLLALGSLLIVIRLIGERSPR
jgi:ubiquinol-cytochrome c reductase cytochrome c subunit